MTINEIKSAILELYKNEDFQKLNAYYSKPTVFGILGAERNENRHSAFIKWLLDPSESHGLGDVALKKFLALYASKAADSELTVPMITGNFKINVKKITTEKVLKTGYRERRVDIWGEFEITDNDGKSFLVPFAIENKVYSKEGDDQTSDYHKGVEKFVKDNPGAACIPVEVFLTPYEKDKAVEESFVHITYQELLDSVIEPISTMSFASEAKAVVLDYIRTLSKPSADRDDDNDGIAIKEELYSTLAVSNKELSLINKVYDSCTDLFKAALYIVGGVKADNVIPEAKDLIEDAQSDDILADFWNCNANVFRSILIRCASRIAPGKENEITEMFKTSKVDRSRYYVQYRNGAKWETANVAGIMSTSPVAVKPISKGKAACLFFQLFLEKNKVENIDKLREIFPSSLSIYYSKRKGDFFGSIVWETGEEDGRWYAINEKGYKVFVDECKWDFFYGGEDYNWGIGTLKDFTRVKFVKMWRKGDFERLLSHIAAHPEWFSNVRIVPAEE